MPQFISILLGVLIAIGIFVVVYPFVIYFKLKGYEKRVKELSYQIRAQMDIKCDLILTLEGTPKDVLNTIEDYRKYTNGYDLKTYNDSFNKFVSTCKNTEVISKCDEAEEKINHIKEYYNEVVNSYNRFKNNKIAAYLSKSFSIADAKLY